MTKIVASMVIVVPVTIVGSVIGAVLTTGAASMIGGRVTTVVIAEGVAETMIAIPALVGPARPLAQIEALAGLRFAPPSAEAR